MGAWDGRRGWIYHLGVRPIYRRKKIATRLIREVESRMTKKGVVKVDELIFGWNEASIGFFLKNGYLVAEMKEAQKSLRAVRASLAGQSISGPAHPLR